MDPTVELLVEDLFDIYAVAGREVTYTTDRGEVRPYWANRFRQAVQRAVQADDVIGFVERLVLQDEPSRGFGYLADAGRLDLTVEALLVDESRDYHKRFSARMIQSARHRLAKYGYKTPLNRAEMPPAQRDVIGDSRLQPGTSFDVRVTVEADGKLTLALIK